MLAASFTGKYPQDQVFISFKDKSIQTHSLNGKMQEKFMSNHTLEIKSTELNVKMQTLMTVSADCC